MTNQHSSRELPSQAAIAEKLDVSISSIKRARTIKATGTPAVLEAVETGALDLTAGAAIAKAPIVGRFLLPWRDMMELRQSLTNLEDALPRILFER